MNIRPSAYRSFLLLIGLAAAAGAQAAQTKAAQSNACEYSSFGLVANGKSLWSSPDQGRVIVQQVNCLLDQFAMNNFLYLVGNDSGGKPRFMSMAPWYTLFTSTGTPEWPGQYMPLSSTDLNKIASQEQAADHYRLLDVNHQTTAYDIRVNQPFFDGVVAGNWYQKTAFDAALAAFQANSAKGGVWLPPTSATAPGVGALEVKTAWRNYGPTQYKHLSKRIKIPINPCPETLMHCEKDSRGDNWGLVGFHLVQKAVNQPAFVWATFEHVANAPDCGPGGSNPIAQQPLSPLTGQAINVNARILNGIGAQTGWHYFNYTGYRNAGGDGSHCSFPTNQQPGTQCLSDPHGPAHTWLAVNVCRTQALLPATPGACANSSADGDNQIAVACLNQSIRANFKKLGLATKWANYQLVGLLWGISGATGFGQFTPACFNINNPESGSSVCPNYNPAGGRLGDGPGAPAFGRAGTADLANTTLETWMQSQMKLNANVGATNCFGCHQAATVGFGQGDMSHLFLRISQ